MDDAEKRALIGRKIAQVSEWIADNTKRVAAHQGQIDQLSRTIASDQVLLQVFSDEMARIEAAMNAPPPPPPPEPPPESPPEPPPEEPAP